MHQSVGNILRTLLHGDPPENVSKASGMVDGALSIAQHAMQTSVHTTLGSSPGALVFSRDMFLNVPLSSDWHAITQKREQLCKRPKTYVRLRTEPEGSRKGT